ncbi:MAG: hypothetical protein II855_05555 [Candidatus Methanomethylophilaceae archaeon]|nr:hypothetical protein [Candidatus Methanomethylophilaceae archaeon]
MAASFDLQSAAAFFEELVETISPYVEWAKSNWLTIVLTGEIIGAVVAIKTCHYRRGFGWLLAALATIWIGGTE